jgi:hypothetical protein
MFPMCEALAHCDESSSCAVGITASGNFLDISSCALATKIGMSDSKAVLWYITRHVFASLA